MQYTVVNGTSELDWQSVVAVCETHSIVRCLPSFGLHPWFVHVRSTTWEEALEATLLQHPRAAIGEVGLHLSSSCIASTADQGAVLRTQLRLAVKIQRPVSVHCVGAGAAELLCRELEAAAPPAGFQRSGLLIHGFSGESKHAKQMQALGAMLSFSAANTRRKTATLLASIAEDRLLLESDAPDGLLPAGNLDGLAFAPPQSRIQLGGLGCACGDDAEWSTCTPRPLNVPVRVWLPLSLRLGLTTHVTPHDAQANLPIIAAAVGRLRGIPVECVEELAWANACRLFHHCLPQTDDAEALR